MRRVVQEQVKPIISIAKENMITNCYKNEEMKHLFEEIQIV